jgi:uncharacterized membrane-anchored protein YhcB (DUF1043 family)
MSWDIGLIIGIILTKIITRALTKILKTVLTREKNIVNYPNEKRLE